MSESAFARLKFSFKNSLVLLLVPIVWMIGTQFFYSKGLEVLSLNWRYKVRGEITAPVKQIYVNVDSESIQFMGERPFPRVFFAEAVKALFDYGKVRVIGIDFVFSEAAHSFLTDSKKIELDNQALREALQKYPNVVLAAAYTPRIDILSESDQLSQFPFIYKGFTDPSKNSLPEQPSVSLIGFNGGTMGLINIDDSISIGGFSQWVPVFAHTPGPTYYTMALEIARLYYNLPKDSIGIIGESVVLKNKQGQTFIKIPLAKKQLVEINYFSQFYSDANTHFSLRQILVASALIKNGSEVQIKEAQTFFEQFNNAIVLIGPTDPLLQDLTLTPLDFHPVPKVGIQGNLIKTIFSGYYITRLPQWANLCIIFFLTLIIVILGTASDRYSNYSKLGALAILILYTFTGFLLFDLSHFVLPIAGPIGSALTTTFVGVIFKLLQEEKQKSRIKNLFGTYISPELVKEIVESKTEPQLGGIEQPITAFFSDVENFSSFSEVLSPNRLVELMNEYLTVMTDTLKHQGGTLDKYIGDAIVAMFGAPVLLKDHALRACLASIQMLREEAALIEKWKKEKADWPPIILNLRTRIGLNTGLATIGNMGSKTRFNYTMMGDSVNLAARCETGAKTYGVYLMVTEETKKEADLLNDTIAFRCLDKIIVKGRAAPIKVFEVLGFKNELNSQVQECIGTYEKGLQSYWDRNWDQAKALFEVSSKLEPFQPNATSNIELNPSLVFIKRSLWMKANPPASDWSGTFQMQTK
jgi:adenylate cyclase